MITKIVVEGPNNVGKTTLINKLQNIYGLNDWKQMHMTSVDDNSFDNYDKLFSSDERIIFDRAHVGEMIYPQRLGRPRELTPQEFYRLCEKFKDGVLYIFVDATIDFIKRGYIDKREPFDEDFTTYEHEMFDLYYNKIKTITSNILKIKNV